VPELSGAARATVGRSHASTALDVKVTWVALGLAVIAAACLISWFAEGQATPRKLIWANPLTEIEGVAQDFQVHLATAAELIQEPVLRPAIYPGRTAPGITGTMHRGFTPAAAEHITPVMASPPGVMPW